MREKLIESMNKKAIEMMEQSLKGVGTGREMRFVGGDVPILASSSKQLASSEWISVEDRLPDVGCDVLFTCRSKEYGVGAYSDTYKDFFMGHFPVKGVTHWMPLPEPPKGE